MKVRSSATGAASLLVLAAAAATPAAAQTINFAGRYTHTGAGTTAGQSETTAYDPTSKRLFVTNAAALRVDVLDLNNPAAPTLITSIPVGGTPNSVAVRGGRVAVAVENATNRQQPGNVQVFDASAPAGSIGTPLAQHEVGAIPDMLTFTPDGTRLLVANEGEPNSYGAAGSVDPVGSVSVINLAGGGQTIGFESFNAQAAALRGQGVRIFGPGASVAQDLEPEYIAVSADSTRAFVTLQEANALATINLQTNAVESIRSFGLKDHNAPAPGGNTPTDTGNGLDPSDREVSSTQGSATIRNAPVSGMYQPDAAATFRAGGQTYLLTANEGDARDYSGFGEEVRVGAAGYPLDPTAFPDASTLKQAANLGRLTVTNRDGDTDGDGDFDRIQAFGARSFSVWNADTGALVFDSGDDIEQIVLAQTPSLFNSGGVATGSDGFDTRSDNKGPEPEGIAVGEAFGKTLGFIGLERASGILMYDLTNPTSPQFLQYINVGDIAPETLTFISAADSPTGQPLLVVANEVSNTTSIFTVAVPEPSALALLGLALPLAVRRGRRAR